MAEINELIEGYRDFYKQYFSSGQTLYRELVSAGQSPKTMIIACSDSRVDPGIITSAQLGDIFVIRNVANLVPPYEAKKAGLHGVSAALEFAVRILNVEHIVVLGHSNCAGIKALLDTSSTQNTDFIGKWMNAAKPARDKTIQNSPGASAEILQHRCENENILFSMHNLLDFPWIKERVEEKRLHLHGWYFSLEDGYLQEYHPEKGKFVRIPVE